MSRIFYNIILSGADPTIIESSLKAYTILTLNVGTDGPEQTV